MTLQLPAQLESALIAEANRLGVTPQSLAVQLIQSNLPNGDHSAAGQAVTLSSEDDLRKWWQRHFDSLPEPSNEPRPDWLRADNSGEAFKRILEERRQQGRL